jgi:MYXO-CTERM domain-containing protein
VLTAGLLVLSPWLAFGGIPEAPPATDRFEPRLERELVGFEDVDFDSGWFPPDSPVQLRFYAHAADSIVIEMLGDGLYDFGAETIAFAGDPMAGWFLLDVGLELQASVRFDVAGIQWQSDILGPWDYAITSEAFYTPYLLPGSPEAPVVIDDQTDGVNVASVPIVPDIIIASGNLDVSVAADITASLAGIRIEATAHDGMGTPGDVAIVDAEGVPSPLSPVAGADPLAVDGVMVASLQTAPVLIVRPHLVMSILGQDFEIFGIDIPIALPETDEALVFDPEPMLFDAPEPPPAADTGLDESGEGGAEGATDADAGSGSTTDGASGTDTDGSVSAGAEDALGGCGCRSTGPRGGTGGALVMMLVALGIVRRRGRAR